MATKYHVNPKMRAYGKARIDITKRAKDERDWQENWREQLYFYPFELAADWKTCFEYKVDDFAAEVGFFMDFLGFPSSAFSPSYAQFTSPDGDFYIGVSAVQDGEDSTLPDTLRIQFNVLDIFDTIAELERRGIMFEGEPKPVHDDSDILVISCRTPHGISIDLWGSDEIASSVIDDYETGNEIENDLEDEFDEDLDDDQIDDMIDELLHQSKEDESEAKIVSDVLEESNPGYTSKRKSDNNPGTESFSRLSDRNRFPHTFEKYNLERPNDKILDHDIQSHNDDKSNNMGITSLGQYSDQKDNELTYQEIDE